MKTLQDIMNACYDRYWANTPSERTVISNVKQVCGYFGPNIHLNSIRTTDVDLFIKHLETQGDAPATINSKLSILSTVFTYAEKRGLVKDRPFIERKKVRNGRVRVITREEESRILEYFLNQSDSLMADLVIVGIDTGLRVGEILALQPAYIIPAGIYIPAEIAKNKQERLIPMTRRVADVMEARKASELFADLDYKSVNYRWNKMKMKLGLLDKEFIPHAMRHTFCSRLAQAGTSPWDIKELAGHSNLSITERYTHHYEQSSLHKAIQKLEV